MKAHSRCRQLSGRRVAAAAAVLVALAVAFALGGCGFSVSCGTDKAGTAEGAVDTYTDADYGYSFSYPAEWALDTEAKAEVEGGIAAANGVSVFDTEGAKAEDYYVNVFQVAVYELSVVVEESMLPDVEPQLESLLAGIAAQDSSWKTLAALSETTAGGLGGFKTTVSHTMDGVPVTSTLYFLFDGSTEYELTVQAATDDWEAGQPAFDAIVASFKPGSAAAGATGITAGDSE